MLKALLFELLKSNMEQERKSYIKPLVYFLNVLGLIQLVIAVFYYIPGTPEFTYFLDSGILLITLSVITEAIRCYCKCKNKYKTINNIKTKSRDIIDSTTTEVASLFTPDMVAKCVPVIIRYVPSTIITFLVCTYIKRKFLKNVSYLSFKK